MLVELCNYCSKYLAVIVHDGKGCCQFCKNSKTK